MSGSTGEGWGEERDLSAEEIETLHLAGFSKVPGLPNVWQYGAPGARARKERKSYPVDEALKLARHKLQGGQI
jgi:hypothetical protein